LIRPFAATLALAAACAPEPDDPPAAPELAAEFDLGLLPASSRVAHLAWHPPACAQVYRVRVDETFPPGLEEFLKTREEHSTSFFALDPAAPGTWPPGPVPQDRVFTGGLVFTGPRSAHRPLRRDFALSAALAGPASPDAACFERTWDAVEDSLALGWPQLTGRLTAAGEEWSGARVESRCNRSACVDPETRGGGPSAHHLPCVTPSWHERLDGVAELASRPSGPELASRPSGPERGPLRVAVISSAWSDGHPVGQGLSSERTAVISVDHGRLLYAHARVHHGYMGIDRDIRIDAVDACPGGLVAAGWDPPEPVVTAREAILAEREKSAKKGR
jgi:hypothetical protein